MSIVFRAMNTDVRVVVPTVRPHEERALAASVKSLFADVEHTFSRFSAGSELSRLNLSQGPVVVRTDLFAALQRAQAYWELTDGWFDVTVGAALRAAGYDRSFAPGTLDRATPSASSVRRVSQRDVRLDPSTSTVETSLEVSIDCGGFIKGWAVDQAVALLPTPCAVDAGGDAAMRGAGPDGLGWRVDVEDPDQPGRSLMSLRVKNRAVATSGINRHHWRVGSADAHHLIDPRTGQPSVSDLTQVTVFADSAELADVLAKAVFLRGLSDGVRLLNRMPSAAAVLIERGGGIRTTGGIGE